MNIWFGRRLRILAWHTFCDISRSQQRQERAVQQRAAQQQREYARIAQQQQARTRAAEQQRASVAQQTRSTALQHITRQEQHEQEKQLKHVSAAQHAESRRFLLPGEEYKTDAPRVVESTSRVAMFTQVPQVISMPPVRPKTPAPRRDPTFNELYRRQPDRKRSRNFKKVNGAWVPME